jgi:uncharacterized protein YjiS (DUF1127 family)
VKAVKSKVSTFFRRRAAIAQLERMTDRELADIGINRYDIKRVVK